ncbi:hypothetical protein BAE44_0018376 [Dichanthelium oligosanthes]|uniref:F-box domain-containing protein n=1 Tax=Dichanthelium oligosanthes TaxID=888268 RepID=A0A1E5V6I3_9POAL|nr:hypothetical protein BAE44_0018376 [Dichanthelium oligosanthes]
MAPLPPVLMEVLVEEIVLRFPADDPARLVHAALVCKQWCRLVSSPGFRRRFHEFHRAPPLLGFLSTVMVDDRDVHIVRFVPAASCPTRADQ